MIKDKKKRDKKKEIIGWELRHLMGRVKGLRRLSDKSASPLFASRGVLITNTNTNTCAITNTNTGTNTSTHTNTGTNTKTITKLQPKNIQMSDVSFKESASPLFATRGVLITDTNTNTCASTNTNTNLKNYKQT